MKISGVEEVVSQVSRVFCAHSISILSSEEHLRSEFRVQGPASQPLVELRYGAPVSIDAGNFRDLYLACHATGGSARIEQDGHAVELASGKTLVMSSGLRTRLALSGSFSQVSLRLNTHLLEQTCARMLGRELDEPIRFQLSPMSTQLSAHWATLLKLPRQQTELTGTGLSKTIGVIEEFLLAWLLTSQPHNFSAEFDAPGKSPEPAIVRKAERIVREHPDGTLTILELAHKTGVSLRTLQAAFKAWRSTTPSAFMRSVKLDTARHKLMQTTVTSVADVAYEAGFTHIGRFSESYRRMFGETPSATMKLARRRSGID